MACFDRSDLGTCDVTLPIDDIPSKRVLCRTLYVGPGEEQSVAGQQNRITSFEHNVAVAQRWEQVAPVHFPLMIVCGSECSDPHSSSVYGMVWMGAHKKLRQIHVALLFARFEHVFRLGGAEKLLLKHII